MKLPTNNSVLKITIVIFAFLAFAPNFASAHQPRITESRLTEVPMPEISKAYYGKLTGEPDVYIIKSDKSFDLYVNVLVPDISGQKKDVSAFILKNDTELASLNGTGFEWKQFYEPFGADKYWKGPEYKARVEAGTYEIRVSSLENDSKYSLAIGEIEAFNSKESLNALTIIPELKKDFFSISPISFVASPLGFGLIAIMYVLAFIFGFIYRTILIRFAKNSPRGVTQNIGKKDRLLRVTIGAALLLLAISTSWSPILIFFSGFAMFEAIFSWCGFYAALGKNTCPID